MTLKKLIARLSKINDTYEVYVCHDKYGTHMPLNKIELGCYDDTLKGFLFADDDDEVAESTDSIVLS